MFEGPFFQYEERDLSKAAEVTFEKSVSVKTLSVAALYGGKICAALDRQHPRDLFDVKLLFENEGFSADIRKAFLVYLISGSRPMVELLNPKLKEGQRAFEGEFSGMTLISVNYQDLEEVKKKLIKMVRESLTLNERRFLLSFKEGRPDWGQLGVVGVDKLPAVQWKLANLSKMDRNKHSQAVRALRDVLGL